MFNVKDISGEDLGAFESVSFIKIGRTGDSNTYPIIMGDESGYRGTWVAVPVDDYEAIKKHFDEVDEKLNELETRTSNMDKLLGEIKPFPFASFGTPEEYESIFGTQLEDDILPLLNVLNHQGEEYTWIDEPKPSYLSDEAISGMVKDIEYKVEVMENHITVETYMHTILYGKHREQRFLQRYHIGIKPLPLVEPSNRDIKRLINIGKEDGEMDEYIKEVKTWQQREKDIDEWSDYKIEVIGQSKDTIKAEIEGFIGRKQMSVSRQNKQGHNLYWNYQDIEINPFAFWISPNDTIPSAFQYLIEEDEL